MREAPFEKQRIHITKRGVPILWRAEKQYISTKKRHLKPSNLEASKHVALQDPQINIFFFYEIH